MVNIHVHTINMAVQLANDNRPFKAGGYVTTATLNQSAMTK